MTEPARRIATYQDVLDAPANMIAEIIDGELHLQPCRELRHAAASSALGEELGPAFKRRRGGPGGWLILDEPELHLDDNVLAPDLAGWRRERLPAVPFDAPWLELPPDWLCEVLSPSTAKIDRLRKMRIYARAGVRHCWLIDPAAHLLEVYRLEAGHWMLLGTHADDEKVRAEPFGAIELDLSVLWEDVAAG